MSPFPPLEICLEQFGTVPGCRGGFQRRDIGATQPYKSNEVSNFRSEGRIGNPLVAFSALYSHVRGADVLLERARAVRYVPADH